jgi:hypothetical protein
MNAQDAKICDEFQNQFDLCELGLRHFGQDERKQLERHFEKCDRCQRWLSDWELIKLSTRELTQLEVPDTVLAGIMTKLEPAPALAKLPMSVNSDVLFGGAGLCVLLLASIFYASEGTEGAVSWCLSFVILLCAHYFFNSRKTGVAVNA